MTNKTDKKTTELAPVWKSNWPNMDRIFDNFRKEFERSFSSFPSVPKMAFLSCDLIDDGDKYVIKAEIPGVKKDEIKLTVSDNSVEISAQHKGEEEEKKKNYLRKERSEVSYYRTLSLPDKVASDKTNAKLTDGILNITIPKSIPTQKSKSNSVRVQ